MTPAEFKQARLTLGLTQLQLADLLGYGDKARVAELERGARNPSPAAQRLLQAYINGYRPSDWPQQVKKE